MRQPIQNISVSKICSTFSIMKKGSNLKKKKIARKQWNIFLTHRILNSFHYYENIFTKIFSDDTLKENIEKTNLVLAQRMTFFSEYSCQNASITVYITKCTIVN